MTSSIAQQAVEDDYNSIVEQTCDPITMKTATGQSVSFLLQHSAASEKHKEVMKLVGSQYACRECVNRSNKFCSLSGNNGPVFFNNSMPLSSTMVDYELYSKLQKLCSEICKEEITGIVIIQNPNVLGFSETLGGFRHWHLTANSVTDSSVISLLQAACDRYLPSMLPVLLEKICESTDAMRDSLKLMETILQKVNYGDKFLGTVRWLLQIIDHVQSSGKPFNAYSSREKWLLGMQALLWANIGKDLQGAVCFSYHQANNNILNLLESAKSEQAMRTMCDDRLSPLNYQRPTADPTEGQVDLGMKHLGDFKNSLLTVSELASTVQGVVTLETPTNLYSSSSAFAAIKVAAANSKKNPSTAASFASRCGKTSETNEIEQLRGMRDVINYLRKNPETSVTINVDDLCPVYVASTTLSRDKIVYPYLWAFQLGFSASQFGMFSQCKVTHIVPTYELKGNHRNTLFIIKEAKVPCNLKNCCFPEFLSSEYSRVCRTAFEKLNTAMPLYIPSTSEPLAFGVGTSVISESGTLMNTVNLVINGINVTINKL